MGDLKAAAQRQFNKRFLKLAVSGQQLDLTLTLQEAGLADGDCATAVRQHVEIFAAWSGFALLVHNSGVVTWGQPGFSSGVRDQLKDALQIAPGRQSFAALKKDGSVVSWGVCSDTPPDLKQVHQIHASSLAFSALFKDGSVVAWSHYEVGGDSSGVQDKLRQVQQILASERGFAAIREDGTAVIWGHPEFEGAPAQASAAHSRD